MLMSYDEFDRMVFKYLNEATRKNIKEILDSIRVKVKCNILHMKPTLQLFLTLINFYFYVKLYNMSFRANLETRS